MQNVQNAAEIQQRVMNLVELYRRKVGYESQIAKAAKEDRDFWEQESIDLMEGNGIGGGIYGTGPHTEVWTKHLMVNEQLLGHFYSEVAGKDAEQEILDRFLPEVYDNTIFTEEEESFLKDHFKEMVNYIILTPSDDCLEFVNHYDQKDALTIPVGVLELISSRVEIAAGSKIYNPNAGFAQFANLFKEHQFVCGGKNAWMQIALYANGINAEIVDDDVIPQTYDDIISYMIGFREEGYLVERLCEAYKKLPAGGKFVLLCPSELLAEKDTSSRWFHDDNKKSKEANMAFRKMLVEDRAIKEIIQLPQVMSNNASHDTYCLLIAEKERMEGDVTFVDARIANNDLDTKHYMLSFDNDKLNAIIQNDGIDPNTGLRKVIQVSSTELLPEILIPQVYVIERPSEAEHPVPLSSLCSMESTRVGDLQFNLPEDTPWIHISDLTPLYTGDLDMSGIRKSDCPNNPPFVEGSNKDYGFDENGKFDDSIWAQIGKPKGQHVLNYRKCTYVDGNTDAVLYEQSAESGVQVAVVRATGKPYAVSSGILVFCPKEDFDVNSLAALLRLPVVYRQLIAYQKYEIGYHLDYILVPTDKRVIGDEKIRMQKEKSVTTEMKENFEDGQKKYRVKLENYQHTMRKHIREIGSAVRRMSRYINEMNYSIDEKEYLNQRLKHISEQKEYLSEDIERLNEENTYGEAKPYDIDHCLKGYIDYFGEDVCSINYSNEIAKELVKKFRDEHKDEKIDKDVQKRMLNVFFKERSATYVDIAEYNFGKIVRNILENAKKHGFNDFKGPEIIERKVEILLCWDDCKQMYRIDFRNNGKPLADGLSKDSFGKFRKYAGETGGSGIGGYEVAETVKYYSGDYSISQEGDWVVISIFLPKSKSHEQERV